MSAELEIEKSSVVELSVDELSVDELSVDELSVDELSVDSERSESSFFEHDIVVILKRTIIIIHKIFFTLYPSK